MAAIITGKRRWYLKRDREGHREYHLVNFIQVDDSDDGPFSVLETPDLPLPGSAWNFGNDSDQWAFCTWEADLKMVREGQKNVHWEVDQVFSTKTTGAGARRCSDQSVSDPLLEPTKISIHSRKDKNEATEDRYGVAITTSSFELMRGPKNEWDDDKWTVKIEKNVPSLNLGFLSTFRNAVNDIPLWGLARRCVRVATMGADRKFYGQCYMYWTLSIEFEIDDRTHDRDLLDEGTKALSGKWNYTTGEWDLVQINGADPDETNAKHFIKFTDRKGNPTRVMLNGRGIPAGSVTNQAGIFMCLADGTVADEVADLEDPSKFIAVSNIVPDGDTLEDVVQNWDAEVTYPYGFVVFIQAGAGTYYINSGPKSKNVNPTGAGTDWLSLGPVLEDFRQGEFVAGTFNKGDYIDDIDGETQAGKIHVEKYHEKNLLFLGIPPDLETPF